jgi:AraC-like DNA-binding protein
MAPDTSTAVANTDPSTTAVATLQSSNETQAPEQLAKPEQQKLSKADLKRQQAFIERIKRTMNRHKCDEKKALELMQQEDYEALPAKEHVKRLEALCAQSFKSIGNDMGAVSENLKALRHNDGAIADAFDINYRAIADLFTETEVRLQAIEYVLNTRLGLTADELAQIQKNVRETATQAAMELQKQIMAKARAEVDAEKAEQMKLRQEAKKQAAEAAEKARIEAELQSTATPAIVGAAKEEGTALPPPPEATTFGD